MKGTKHENIDHVVVNMYGVHTLSLQYTTDTPRTIQRKGTKHENIDHV